MKKKTQGYICIAYLDMQVGKRSKVEEVLLELRNLKYIKGFEWRLNNLQVIETIKTMTQMLVMHSIWMSSFIFQSADDV